MQVGLGMPNVPVLHLVAFGSVTLSTSCWSIWPTFSASVIVLSSASTRAEIDLLASSHGAGAESALAGPAIVGKPRPSAAISDVAATTVFRHTRAGTILVCIWNT